MRAHGFDSDYRPCYSRRNTTAIKGVEEDETPLWEMKEAWGIGLLSCAVSEKDRGEEEEGLCGKIYRDLNFTDS